MSLAGCTVVDGGGAAGSVATKATPNGMRPTAAMAAIALGAVERCTCMGSPSRCWGAEPAGCGSTVRVARQRSRRVGPCTHLRAHDSDSGTVARLSTTYGAWGRAHIVRSDYGPGFTLRG